MAELVLGAVGAVVGAQFGNPQLGFAIGVTLGGALFGRSQTIDNGRLDDLRVQGATTGVAIPIIYGKERVAGNIIWTAGAKSFEERQRSGGGKGGGGGVTTVNRYVVTSLDVLVCESAQTLPEWAARTCSIKRIWAQSDLVADYRSGSVLASWLDGSNIRVYSGAETDLPDSFVEASVGGPGYLPAYRGLCHVVFQELNLKQLNNQVPNLSFEVDSGSWTLQQVMNDICDRNAILSANRDFSALAAITVDGLVVDKRTEGSKLMELLSQAYHFDVIEADGKIKAVLRGGSPSFSILKSDIGAGLSGPAVDRIGVESVRTQETEIPRIMTINYNAPSIDYQQFTQTAQRSVRWSENQDSVTFPMTFTDDKAKQIVSIELASRWASRDSHTLTCSWRFLHLLPGDVGNIETEYGTDLVRIVDVTAGLLGPVEFTMVSEDPSAYISAAIGDVPEGSGSTVATYGATAFHVRELNAVTDEDAYDDRCLFYGAAGRAGFHGGQIEVASTAHPSTLLPGVNQYFQGFSGSTQVPMRSDSSSDFGFSTADSLGLLPAGVIGRIDSVSTVRVTFATAYTPASISYDELLAGGNLCVLGDEILQFQTATLISGSTYELKDFVRGRRGTEYAVSTHVQHEPFAMVNSRSLRAYHNLSAANSRYDWREIDYSNTYPSGFPDYSITTYLSCRSRKPYAPVNLDATRDGSNNSTLTWIRRARKSGELVDLTDTPLDETVEKYEIEILHPSTSTVLRTLTALTSSVSYTAANQVTDLGAAGPFRFRVFQITMAGGIGRGHSSELKAVS